MKKAFVSGASGFIGRRLCRRLKADGYYVIAQGRQNTLDIEVDEYHQIDLVYNSLADSLLNGVDVVFHLAGKAHALSEVPGSHDDSYEAINYQATIKLLESAKHHHVRAFVFFSTVKVFGELTGAKCAQYNTPVNPQTAYARSKLKAEDALIKSQYVTHPVALRLSMVYGPQSKGNLVRMIKAIRAGWFPPIPQVDNKRSMVHVDDVINIAMLSSDSEVAKGKRYIVSDAEYYSTGAIYRYIRNVSGLADKRIYMPVALLKLFALSGDLFGRLFRRRFTLDSDSLSKLVDSECYDSSVTTGELSYNFRNNLWAYLDQLSNEQ